MKRNFLYISIALASAIMLNACSDNDNIGAGENNASSNAIKLAVGINNGSHAISRAALTDHYAMQANTQIRLKVDGKWTGKSPEDITKTTTCKAFADDANDNTGDEAILDNINALNFNSSEVIYWDDYGIGDPANKTNRDAGIKVLGVAVDGETTAPVVSNWENLPWTVSTDGTNVLAKDIICSNNLTAFKFDDRNDNEKRLMDFHHVLSKVTINLTASDGFTASKFASAPEVVLTHNIGEETTNNEYLYNGNVNISTCSASATSDYSKVKALVTSSAEASPVVEEAIIYPGSDLGQNDDAVIARINADGNIYYVRAKELRAAILAKEGGSPDYNAKAGYNYILNIIVKKTQIIVTATITDWVTVEASAEPVINVAASITGTATDKKDGFTSFDFYLSDASNANASALYEKKATASNNESDPADGVKIWDFNTRLYWPSHTTHYFMRGVYPTETAVTNGKISVTNGDYNSASFPSNLIVGAPEFTDANKMCNNSDHASVDMSVNGICAREGTINLHFNYMMSQVEVHLKTSTGSEKVNLENAQVDIVNGYTAGIVDIHNKTVATTGDTEDFTINNITGEDVNYRHSIIVPQPLSNSVGDLKFKITITNTDGTTDIYFATIKSISVSESGSAAKNITEWESGKRYIYTLEMRKTEIKTSATLTPWETATADQEIWF